MDPVIPKSQSGDSTNQNPDPQPWIELCGNWWNHSQICSQWSVNSAGSVFCPGATQTLEQCKTYRAKYDICLTFSEYGCFIISVCGTTVIM